MNKDIRSYVISMLTELADLADSAGDSGLAKRIREAGGAKDIPPQKRSFDDHDGHAGH